MAKKTTKKEVFDFRSIKTPEDAFKKCGYELSAVPDVSLIPGKFAAAIRAAIILAIVYEAVNDGWQPDYSNHNQSKYFPWPWVSGSGLDFSASYSNCGYAGAGVGFPLCTNTREKALYILEQFPDLLKEWLLNVH